MSTAPKTNPHDALEFLAADHKVLLAMFRDHEQHKKAATRVEKGKEALRICHRLSIHCAIKEEHFYPAAAAVMGPKADRVLTDVEAQIGELRGLIVKIGNLSSGDSSFDPAVKDLGAAARRHFTAEENELFPLLRHADFDRAGADERLATRAAELSTAPPGKATVREARRVLGG
jgi:hypothetical protein